MNGIVVITAVIAIISPISAIEKRYSPMLCNINEEFHDSGPLCEGCGPRCLAITYEAKCYCKVGFSRLNGICIPDELCPQVNPMPCPPNEEYLSCGSGCPKTCEDLHIPLGKACAAVCVEGCFCKAGLIRNKKGVCVLPSQCDLVPTCPVNEEYLTCGSGCAPTCDSIHTPGGVACAAVCVEGCFCRNGLVRNKQKMCVPPSQCETSVMCPPNEEFGCKQPSDCQTCEHKEICPTFVCDPGCLCKPGFYRLNGICVPEFFCSIAVCPVNEEYLTCGSGCAPTCDSINTPGGVGCAAVCVKGCFCKNGLVRNRQKVCVHPSQCGPTCAQFQRCPQFEVFNIQGPACEGCPPRCAALSLIPKCYCNYPFARINGVCRPAYECPGGLPGRGK